VLLCDGQAVWRAGLRSILSEQPDIEIVGEASDGARAVELARSLTPDLVLMDLRMPQLDGVQATLRLAGPTAKRPVRVVILTVLDADVYALEALRAGATGFLLKDLPGPELVDAVRLAATGAVVLAPSVTSRLLDRFARRALVREAGPEAALERLTGREREVLHLVALGRLNHEIAASLRVGEATVRSHIARILTKLRLRDRAQLVVLAFEVGLVDLPLRLSSDRVAD
jgi:DNA-binding NarL/FixJ family response regulator